MARRISHSIWAALAVVFFAAGPRPVAADDLFDARGFDRQRRLFNQLPFEHIDPLTGNLLLTFTDLVLPGNAGFDLRIQRTYNSKIHLNYIGGQTTLREDSWAGIGWTLHMGRVFNGSGVDTANPVIELPDGSLHPTYVLAAADSPAGCSPCYITREYWIYNKGTTKLLMTNGVEYTFGHTGSGVTGGNGARYATLIDDAFGNRIEATYRTSTPTDALSQIVHRVGAQSRTVTFGVANGALSSMTYSGRTWTYQQTDNLAGTTFSPFTVLTSVVPPVGPNWTYEYTGTGSVRYELRKLTTPNGGTIDYTYRDNSFAVGTSYGVVARVVGTRVVGGRDVTGGSWTYTYPTGTSNQTTVTGPCVSMTYTFEASARTPQSSARGASGCRAPCRTRKRPSRCRGRPARLYRRTTCSSA